jgi:broad specificity phosphatase PhoE
MQITLVRHGRSAHVHTGWLDFDGFLRWREAYERAAILETEIAPPELCALAAKATTLVASNAPRAIASAEKLAPGREVLVTPLVRELELQPPRLLGLKWPGIVWMLAFAVRGLKPTEAEAARVREAAKLLHNFGDAVVVTHGAVRPAIARELVKLGWHQGGARRSHHWSAWTLTMPAALRKESSAGRE